MSFWTVTFFMGAPRCLGVRHHPVCPFPEAVKQGNYSQIISCAQWQQDESEEPASGVADKFTLSELRFVLWASCTTFRFLIPLISGKELPNSAMCFTELKPELFCVMLALLFSDLFHAATWSQKCQGPSSPQPQRAQGVQLLLKALCVKLKPAILPRQFGAALWFLTKVISALLPLLNKKALMVSILWDGGGVQGFHPSCLPESFLPLERRDLQCLLFQDLACVIPIMTFPPTRSNELQTLFAASCLGKAPKMCSGGWSDSGCAGSSSLQCLIRFICVNWGLSSDNSIWLKGQHHPRLLPCPFNSCPGSTSTHRGNN